MTIAEVPCNLNRRHRAALCGTLLCVGLIVLNGGSIRASIGIGLLGLAFSYTFGSNSRLMHWSFLIVGILLLGVVIWEGHEWPKTKVELIGDYASEIDADKTIIRTDIQTDVSDPRALTRGELAKDNEELFKAERELENLKAEGSVRHVMKNDWGIIAVGLLLFISGLGLIVGINE
jgi:hypothetical protein